MLHALLEDNEKTGEFEANAKCAESMPGLKASALLHLVEN
jgi:hypothetical protein